MLMDTIGRNATSSDWLGGWSNESTRARRIPIEAKPAITVESDLPELPPEIISGIVRQGGKLLLAGASQSGKSYLLVELAVAVATGSTWVGFACAKGRVLYVNLEI